MADNAPYHHKRVIGSLASLTKKGMVQMMVSHSIEYVDLPFTNDNRYDLDLVYDDAQDRGDCIRIDFNTDEQLKRAGVNSPRVRTLNELKLSFIT